MHPLDNTVSEESDVSSSVRKMAPYTHSNRPDFDAIFKFDFTIGQDRGLKSFQYGSSAIILKSTKVVNFNRNDAETETLFDKRQTQITQKFLERIVLLEQKKTQCSHKKNQLGETDAIMCGTSTEKPSA